MLIRPVAPKDLDALYRIADESGPGFTSLMPDRDALLRKIEHSVESFAREVETPSDEHYLFVLEDPATGAIMGTTGIEACAGQTRPLYHFHHNTVVHHSRELGLRKQVDTLTRCNHYTGCTEICSLYLRPDFRRANAGKLLSRVRFLFMAQHPERFSSTVIAEMRGVSDAAGQSPFWSWLREHFVDMEFASATSLVGSGYTDFIDELMPAAPLYTHLMSRDARAVIGQVHPHTRPALRMLEREGFRPRGFVDLFDAGPTVEAELRQIGSIRQSRRASVILDANAVDAPHDLMAPMIVANGRLSDFRATFTEHGNLLPTGESVKIASQLAENLGLEADGVVWSLPLQPNSASRPHEQPVAPNMNAHRFGERQHAH